MATYRFVWIVVAALALPSAATPQLLGPEVPHAISGTGVRSVVAADMDGDGNADVVVAAYNVNGVFVLLGDGAGGFSASVPVAGNATDVAVADLNGDRILDIVAAGLASRVYFGDGMGGFSAPAVFQFFLGVKSGIADVSDDGNPDVVVATAEEVIVMLGDGAGSFGAPTNWSSGTTVDDFTIGDVDDDGLPDVVVSGALFFGGPCAVSVLRSVGAGSFLPPVVTDPGCTGGVPRLRSIVLGKVDADSNLDAVVTFGEVIPTSMAIDIAVFLGDGAGGFTPVSLSPLSVLAKEAAVADMDLDGFLDIVATDDASVVKVLLNDGTGSFTHSCPALCFPIASGSPGALAIRDLNGDGKPDVVVADDTAASISVLLNQTATPAGLGAFGTGTPGCFGSIALCASSVPAVGNADFRVTCANAPPSALGWAAFGQKNVAGSQIRGLTIHVNGAGMVIAQGFLTDTAGTGFFDLPIPSVSELRGLAVSVQGLWVPALADGETCTPPLLGLVASKGLELTIQ